ncbi:MAG: shikimate kinase [Acidobacteriota bacterium]
MDGYYDYGPLVSLERSIVLAGLITDDTRMVGYRVAALLGLPYTDLDRSIEHHAGTSVERLITEQGVDRYRTFERELLARHLVATPPGILTLGDGTLLEADSRQRVASSGRLIVLEHDLANFYWRLIGIKQAREAEEAAPARHAGWHVLNPEPLTRIEQLRPFFQARVDAWADTGPAHAVPIVGASPLAAVDVIVDWVRAHGD